MEKKYLGLRLANPKRWKPPGMAPAHAETAAEQAEKEEVHERYLLDGPGNH